MAKRKHTVTKHIGSQHVNAISSFALLLPATSRGRAIVTVQYWRCTTCKRHNNCMCHESRTTLVWQTYN